MLVRLQQKNNNIVYVLQDATSGRTALHYAVELENFMLVNFLMESGVDANATTFAGELMCWV